MTGDPFTDAAARFGRIVTDIKTAQCARTGARPAPPTPAPGAGDPQTAWDRQFGTRSLRPGREIKAEPRLWEGSPLAGPAAEPPAAPEPPQEAGPIGLAIGKPVRRSWVRRLFGRK